MVAGLGTDVIEIERVARSLTRFGDRFLARVFTPGEIEYARKRGKGQVESLAARFAAKEAGAKALGTGISRGVSWQDIEVVRMPGQPPRIVFHGRARERAEHLGVNNASLSLTHGRDFAMAVVVLES